MSGKQEIVEVYVKKERKPEQSGGKNKGKNKGNNYRQNDYPEEKNGTHNFTKQDIINRFHEQEQISLQNQLKKADMFQGQTIEEEKQDFEVKIKQIQDLLGDQIGKKQIKNALRSNNMNLEDTIEQLLQLNLGGVKQSSNSSNLNSSGGNKLNISSSNSQSSDGYLNLRQADSEEKEGKLRLSQKSSDKESPMKLKQYQQKINTIRQVRDDLSNEIIIEALEMHQGNEADTIVYLLEDENIKSLEVCLQEHNQDLGQVNNHLDQIVDDIIEEEEENEFQLMMAIENDEIEEFNVEEDLYLLNIKKSMSQEEQADPEIMRFLKVSAIFAKQLEIFNDINEQIFILKFIQLIILHNIFVLPKLKVIYFQKLVFQYFAFQKVTVFYKIKNGMKSRDTFCLQCQRNIINFDE